MLVSVSAPTIAGTKASTKLKSDRIEHYFDEKSFSKPFLMGTAMFIGMMPKDIAEGIVLWFVQAI